MANHETKIDGYTVEVTTGFATDSGTNGCWISKGKWSASLAALEDMGNLSDDEGNYNHRVPEITIDRIREWSASKGY